MFKNPSNFQKFPDADPEADDLKILSVLQCPQTHLR